MFKRLGIQFKITVLLIAILLLAVILNIAWSNYTQTRQAEKEMLEKTQILNQEMKAVWEFIDINQQRIDTDADGNYNFKNIYCAIAGKSVAALFMRDTDYVVRYVSLEPRRANSRPDGFEEMALKAFGRSDEAKEDAGIAESAGAAEEAGAEDAGGDEEREMYDITEHDGEQVFRYTSPIYIKESCLDCHGSPVGEIDVTGFPKEGLREGDLAGAVSIIMPIDLYMQGIQSNILQQSVYFFAVFSVLIIIAFLAISYLVRRLEKANELLQKESEYKSDFLAVMSHELRTPLTSIIAFTEIWEKTAGRLSEDERQPIQEVKENSSLLLQMINNILEVARMGAGKTKLNCEWVDMVDLISTVDGTVRPLAERKELAFMTRVAADTPLIYADWEKLRRILENLVYNAVKFTRHGGEVSIEVAPGVNGQGQDELRCEVRDTGIGIKEEDIGRLFEKFTQLDKSAHRRYRGSGLGLAVVKELTEAHGGFVEVRSVFQQGSVFIVHIPTDNRKWEDHEDTAC
jgi:signal transduction histidine kinase